MIKTAIIGAGPAGMMAATVAKGQVELFEKNEKFGKKLYITGKGRCNITNNIEISEFIDKVNRNPYFCYSAFYSFTNQNLIEFFNNNGLKTKVERGERVFPQSNKSSDVIKVFEKYLRNKKVNIHLNTEIKDILLDENGFILITTGAPMHFDRLILATGGLSYASTGSTGFGMSIAEKFGHTIIKPLPSLVPIRVQESWVKELTGLSLRNVKLNYHQRGKNYSYFGDLLFNDDGLTGPVSLSMSTHGREFIAGDSLFIDLKPALSFEQLEKRVLRDFQKYTNKDVENGLVDLLPKRCILPILRLCNIEATKKIHQISKNERDQLIKIIKAFPLKFKELRSFKEAIITNGGVSTDEINPSTLESKIVPGLYFAGEMIDLDAMTGGFNLQIAFSTGYIAGINAGEENV